MKDKPTHTPLLWRIGPALFIAAFFLFFTWRGMLVYYTGDDVMNLWKYWTLPVSRLITANIFFWTPNYRPFGGLVYCALFALFGFNPRPLYLVYYAFLLLNLYVAYLVIKRISGAAEIGALATLLWSIHGNLYYLYYNAGSMYDVFCFLFFFLAFHIYLRARQRGEYLSGWSLAAFIASFICCLNSKEMGATLPVILLVYELLFHAPHRRSISELGRWFVNEGRGALIAGVCIVGYIPAKLSSQGLTSSPAYVPHFTWPTYLHDSAVYLGYLTYASHPFTTAQVAAFYAALVAAAFLLRSRLMWFGLLFFQITLLPVSFVSAREGFVLYLPLAGLALYFATLLVWIKDKLLAINPKLLHSSGLPAVILLFVATALSIGTIHWTHWRPAPDPKSSPIRILKEQLSRMYPAMRHGSRILFDHTPFDGSSWDPVFTLLLAYQDKDLVITQMYGPTQQRVPLDRLGPYDHIFSYEGNQYVELDNSDSRRSLRLHLVKEDRPGGHIGENMAVEREDAYKYFVNDIVFWQPKTLECWTLEAPELKFWLLSNQHRLLTIHFRLPKETLAQTGPLNTDFFVNDQLLGHGRYATDGDHTFQHSVPSGWLKPNDYTIVRMQVRNPYIAPADGAKLGVLLVSAGFDN